MEKGRRKSAQGGAGWTAGARERGEPPQTINYIYGLVATDRPYISSDHKTRQQTHTQTPNHQTQAHRAQTQITTSARTHTAPYSIPPIQRKSLEASSGCRTLADGLASSSA